MMKVAVCAVLLAGLSVAAAQAQDTPAPVAAAPVDTEKDKQIAAMQAADPRCKK